MVPGTSGVALRAAAETAVKSQVSTLILASLKASESMFLIGFPCNEVKLIASKLTKAFVGRLSMLFSRRISLEVRSG
jgi:hypothetical protein